MTNQVPRVSIIIPARPGEGASVAVEAARQLKYPKDHLEILLVRGRQPAVQRNQAVRQATGDLVYFLDDDAQAQPDNLLRAVAAFRQPEVKMIGGPNLCPDDAPWLEQIFAVVLASYLAFGPSRARYAPIGRRRISGEKELILCNLIVRRDSFMAAGGFDEALYPNEENALMDHLQASGGQLLYDPEFVAYRRPRPSLRAFSKMLFRYGRGRAEQFRLHPTWGSLLNFVPPFFCLYLAGLPVVAWQWPEVFPAYTVPLVLYGIVVLVQTMLSALGQWGMRSFPALPLIVLTHLLYGIGFWCGLFTRLRPASLRQSAEVVVEKLKS